MEDEEWKWKMENKGRTMRNGMENEEWKMQLRIKNEEWGMENRERRIGNREWRMGLNWTENISDLKRVSNLFQAKYKVWHISLQVPWLTGVISSVARFFLTAWPHEEDSLLSSLLMAMTLTLVVIMKNWKWSLMEREKFLSIPASPWDTRESAFFSK